MDSGQGYLPAGTPVDLSNCEREPIHIPGRVQPHGVLLTVGAEDERVRQVSANSGQIFGQPPSELLGRPLTELIADEDHAQLREAMDGTRVSTLGAPLNVAVADGLGAPGGWYDALVHRSGDVWIIELEPQSGDLMVGNTLRDVRHAVAELSSTGSVDELLQTAVEQVRALTGFDRVMVYRFDAEWNGTVVAETRREGIEAFRGLRYPASDIPPQARALYTVNWLRFIRDVEAVDAPLVPVADPVSGQPLDLSSAALRSVSPIHTQYLRNMGVTASMSVSLVVDGRLAGLIACHHYAGPYVPSAPVRATCEFLAQTLSLMLGGRERDARASRREAIQRALDALRLEAGPDGQDIAPLVARHARALMSVLSATGMVWTVEGRTSTAGVVPGEAEVDLLRTWLHRRQPSEGLVVTHRLGGEDEQLGHLAERASGVLGLVLGEQEEVLFLRPEAVQVVDWGGNPHLKTLRTDGRGSAELTPRSSFAQWREIVRQRSQPWEDVEVEAAGRLRTDLVQMMFERNRALASVAATLQRSVLPDPLPPVPGYELAADYRPASVGVGGDWYDVVVLPSGRVLTVLGDVAGHGLVAAGAMSQLRNALRAYAVEELDESDPGRLLERLDSLVGLLNPHAMATVAVAVLDPATGHVRVASAGHPPPIVMRRDEPASLLPVDPEPPLGAGSLHEGRRRAVATARLDPGDCLLLVSDGMFERRDQAVDRSLLALAARAGELVSGAADLGDFLHSLLTAERPASSDDDATVLVVRRS